MSKFRINQIHPGRKTLKTRLKEKVGFVKRNAPPFLLGLSFALVFAMQANYEGNKQAWSLFETFQNLERRVPITYAAESVTEEPKQTPKPAWVEHSKQVIETWSEVKMSPTEAEHVTKARVLHALMVSYGESGWSEANSNSQGNTPPSTDRGFWMFNSYHRADVSDKCAYEFECANTEAIKTYKGRKNFSAWHARKVFGIN